MYQPFDNQHLFLQVPGVPLNQGVNFPHPFQSMPAPRKKERKRNTCQKCGKTNDHGQYKGLFSKVLFK